MHSKDKEYLKVFHYLQTEREQLKQICNTYRLWCKQSVPKTFAATLKLLTVVGTILLDYKYIFYGKIQTNFRSVDRIVTFQKHELLSYGGAIAIINEYPTVAIHQRIPSGLYHTITIIFKFKGSNEPLNVHCSKENKFHNMCQLVGE